MRKLLTLVLIVALGAAAFFTRPMDPKKNFTDYLVNKTTKGDDSFVKAGWDEMRARHYAENCEYRDRLLWVDVRKDHQTVYTGAFAHWFNRAEIKREAEHDLHKAEHQLDKVTEKAHEKLSS